MIFNFRSKYWLFVIVSILLTLSSGCVDPKFNLKQINNKSYSGSVIYNCYNFDCDSGFQIIKDNTSYYSIFINKHGTEYRIDYPFEGELTDVYGFVSYKGNGLSRLEDTPTYVPDNYNPDMQFIYAYIYIISSFNNNNYLYSFSVDASIQYKKIPKSKRYDNNSKIYICDYKLSKLELSSRTLFKVETKSDKIVCNWFNIDNNESNLLCQSKDFTRLDYFDIKGNLLFSNKLDKPMIITGASEESAEIKICGYDGRYFAFYTILDNKIKLIKATDTQEDGILSESFFNDKYLNKMHPLFVLRDYVSLFNGKRIFIIDPRSYSILYVNDKLITTAYGRDIFYLDDGVYRLKVRYNRRNNLSLISSWKLDKIASGNPVQIFIIGKDVYNYGFVISNSNSSEIIVMKRDLSVFSFDQLDIFKTYHSIVVPGHFSFSYADRDNIWIATSKGLYNFTIEDINK